MRFPSIKTILTLRKFNNDPITLAEARTIRAAMEERKGLRVGNDILQGCGIEVIGLPDGCFNNCQTPDITIRYVNMGDTYDRTILKVNGAYRIGDWGSIVERY